VGGEKTNFSFQGHWAEVFHTHAPYLALYPPTTDLSFLRNRAILLFEEAYFALNFIYV